MKAAGVAPRAGGGKPAAAASDLGRPQRNRPDGDNPFVKLAGVADIRGVKGLQGMKFGVTETTEPKHVARHRPPRIAAAEFVIAVEYRQRRSPPPY